MHPTLKKLQLKNQKEIVLINDPEEFAEVRNELANSNEVELRTNIPRSQKINFFLGFAKLKNEVDAFAAKIPDKLADDAMCWIAYPKKSSKKYECDFGRDTGWEAWGALGFEPVRLIALDEDWSAMRMRKVEHIKTMTRSKKMTISKEGKRKTTG